MPKGGSVANEACFAMEEGSKQSSKLPIVYYTQDGSNCSEPCDKLNFQCIGILGSEAQ
jgi:hypothetical protein